ncbi:hypothetical protein CFBP1590__2488 [Pseudomonas viridiflava]|uniref:DUF72 domain-containing protein n=1 Tax=Pseudomonas viridiflava TaxID=33069 RepID=A0A1Y6JK01_PSEVI|nr:DUF72 domain-containing protein [Pseudomonas viridiflava]SMS10074.1 hypothetical protein CFBP1590__2488 [Pseudomonas viridiflava]VVN80604.1 hypothetical protein PS689_01078 [Pseudomonas fluorescens]
MSAFLIGCAGWSLARQYWSVFPDEGTHLQRYAARFNAVEINSSFYRPHRPETYARWADSVPEGFRFSVKLPRAISHELRLHDCESLLRGFLEQCMQLGDKLGCLLIQLPPSFRYDPEIAQRFFALLRECYAGHVVLEPRHDSWRQAQPLLVEQYIGQVAADPSPVSGGDVPAGWEGVRYWRLHGSPQIYHSPYGADRLAKSAEQLRRSGQEGAATWCLFDNTASGAAVGDALGLQELLTD